MIINFCAPNWDLPTNLPLEGFNYNALGANYSWTTWIVMSHKVATQNWGRRQVGDAPCRTIVPVAAGKRRLDMPCANTEGGHVRAPRGPYG